jgi:hypothetical protein
VVLEVNLYAFGKSSFGSRCANMTVPFFAAFEGETIVTEVERCT